MQRGLWANMDLWPGSFRPGEVLENWLVSAGSGNRFGSAAAGSSNQPPLRKYSWLENVARGSMSREPNGRADCHYVRFGCAREEPECDACGVSGGCRTVLVIVSLRLCYWVGRGCFVPGGMLGELGRQAADGRSKLTALNHVARLCEHEPVFPAEKWSGLRQGVFEDDDNGAS